jgi:hypothetical protein
MDGSAKARKGLNKQKITINPNLNGATRLRLIVFKKCFIPVPELWTLLKALMQKLFRA